MAPDPDFPDNPELAASLQTRLDRLQASLSVDYWETLRPLVSIAQLLHQQLWAQPDAAPLLAELSRATGLTTRHIDHLLTLADLRAYLRELLLRGDLLYAFVTVAHHLLDGPLGSHTLNLALGTADAPAPDPAVAERLRTHYSALLTRWQQTLGEIIAGAADDPAAAEARHLLDLQVASMLGRATLLPTIGRAALGSRAPWPVPPAPNAPFFDYQWPFTQFTVLRLGISYLVLAAYRPASAWATTLQTELPAATFPRLLALLQTLQEAPLRQPLVLRLGLPAAAELHLAAHLSGSLAASAIWDAVDQEDPAHLPLRTLADELPPGISLPPPDPDALTIRQAVGLVANEVIRQLETHFGADTPALVANRHLAARLAPA